MRVAFLLPPAHLRGPARRPRHWPIFAASAAAALREDGHQVSVLDAHLLRPDPVGTAWRILQTRPDLVFLSQSDYTRRVPSAIVDQHAQALQAQRSTLPVYAFGRLSAKAAARLRTELPHVQGVTVGEPEAAARAVLAGGDRGVLLASGDPVQPAALDRLPKVPAWDLLPPRQYAFSPHQSRGGTVFPLMTTRGCPYHCFYCEAQQRPAFASRAVSAVIEEVRLLREHFGARALFIADPTFGLQRERTLKLCAGLAPLDMQWTAMCRTDRCDPVLFSAMARAGCYGVLFGIESLNAKALKAAGKDLDPATVGPAIRAARAAGLEVIVSVLVGMPGDDPAGFQDTVRGLIQMGPDFAQFFGIRVPKSLAEAEGSLVSGGFVGDYDYQGELFLGSGFTGTDQVDALCRQAYRRFYLRPAYLGQRLGACRQRPRSELRRGLLGARILLGRALGVL